MALGTRDRYVGCLLGNAVGDALGSPMEWLSVDVIREANTKPCLDDYVDEGRRIVEMTPGSTYAEALKEVPGIKVTIENHFKRSARKTGWTTDDNLFTMILAETIAAGGALDMDSFAKRLADLGDFSDIGSTTRRAIKALSRYASIPGVWKVTGREVVKRSLRDKGWPDGAVASNGALMRVAPVGVSNANSSPDTISRDAILSTIVTHDSDVCAWSSAFMAHVIANLAGGRSKELSVELAAHEVQQDGSVLNLFDEPYEARLWHRDRGGEQIFQDVRRYPATVKGYNPVTRAALDCLRGRHGAHDLQIEDVGSRKDFFYVLHALRVATHHFLHTDSFEEALVRCVNHGGDTDTYAAICGAMAGTYYGARAIPSRWTAAINAGVPDKKPKLYYTVREIETIAQNLFTTADAQRPRQTIFVG